MYFMFFTHTVILINIKNTFLDGNVLLRIKDFSRTSVTIQGLFNPATFPIQILLPFPIFKLLPNFIFQCYRPQTWQFYLVFPALFISGTHKVPGG